MTGTGEAKASEPEKRTRLIAFRVTGSELANIRRCAEEEKQHLLEWCRETVVGVADVQAGDYEYELTEKGKAEIV